MEVEVKVKVEVEGLVLEGFCGRLDLGMINGVYGKKLKE
jgi:hypothetical protein